MTTTLTKTETPKTLDPRVLSRILDEGYGPEAWHGPDMKAALDGVTDEAAAWRPGAGRHSIAEIVLHHAYVARAARGKLSGTAPEPFPFEGDDWFALPEKGGPSWAKVRKTLETEQDRLAATVAGIAAGRVVSPLSDAERFDLALGVTCHAVYHAGQIQLIKRLREG